MTLTPAAAKFIKTIEALDAWNETTTLLEVSGHPLTLKTARTLVSELKSFAIFIANPALVPADSALKPGTIVEIQQPSPSTNPPNPTDSQTESPGSTTVPTAPQQTSDNT